MAEPLPPRAASDAQGHLPGPLGLRLDEDFLPLTALHDAPDVLDAYLPLGGARQNDETLMLRFAPDMVLVSGRLPTGPRIAVDVGHGFSRFLLRGGEALPFLGQYTSADLQAAPVRQARAIRTRLNHYDCALWWPDAQEVNILVDRSIAQSFADHLRALSLRHDRPDPSQSPLPEAPPAPDRKS